VESGDGEARKSQVSGSRYTSSMVDLELSIGSPSVALRLGEIVREARRLAGWTQRELAARAATNQATVCRLERGRMTVLDVLIVERVLDALGMRASLGIEGRHLADRRRQRDPVHARINGFLAGQLTRRGFSAALEVQIGDTSPRGWIDLLAYRPQDRALIVEESKGDLPDVGAFQRSLRFYERSALRVANGMGWRPTRVVVLAALLDSVTIADRLAENRELIQHGFPSPVERLLAWIDDPRAPAPFGWTLATCDPASRSAAWLRPTTLGRRRKPAAYADYADAAARLVPGRRLRR
jgi:transcriptional regulator with XRE-family HTH domain